MQNYLFCVVGSNYPILNYGIDKGVFLNTNIQHCQTEATLWQRWQCLSEEDKINIFSIPFKKSSGCT